MVAVSRNNEISRPDISLYGRGLTCGLAEPGRGWLPGLSPAAWRLAWLPLASAPSLLGSAYAPGRRLAGLPRLPCSVIGGRITKLTSRRFRYFVISVPYNDITELAAQIFRYMDGASPEGWPSPARPGCRANPSLLRRLAGPPWHPLPGCLALPVLLVAAGPAGLACPAPRSGAV